MSRVLVTGGLPRPAHPYQRVTVQQYSPRPAPALQPGRRMVLVAAALTLIPALRTPAADTTAPSAPRNVQAAVLGASQVEVHWIASIDDVGVAGYRVYRAVGGHYLGRWPGPFVAVGSVADTTVFTDTTAAAQTFYTYGVTAFDWSGNESRPGSLSGVDHNYITTFPEGYSATVEVTHPPSVAPGGTLTIRRRHGYDPAGSIQPAHSDIHYIPDADVANYTTLMFQPGPNNRLDATAQLAVGTAPGMYFLYAETHVSWPGFPSGNMFPWGQEVTSSVICSAWSRVLVTGGDPLAIRPSALPSSRLDVPYDERLEAVGEIGGPYLWGVTHGGRLPDGLSLDRASGVLSGTPREAGRFAFTVLLEAESGSQAERRFELAVDGGGVATPTAGPSATPTATPTAPPASTPEPHWRAFLPRLLRGG